MEKNLMDVLQNRLDEKFKTGSARANAFVAAMIEEVKNQRDFLIRPNNDRDGIDFVANGKIRMRINSNDHEYTLHPHAITQIGEKFNIPTAYLNKLAEAGDSQRGLAVDILKHHRDWAKDSSLYLIRAVQDTVKGFLSNSYMRMDTGLVLASFFQSVQDNDATIADCFKSDTRYWVEALIPGIIKVPTEKNGEVGLVFGTRLGNSDYGDGALDIRSFFMQAICMNGMVRESLMSRVHLGKKLGDSIAISSDTYRKESETIAGAVRDITKFALSEGTIRDNITQVQAAAGATVNLEREFLALATKGVAKAEIKEIGTILTQNNPDDGLSGEATLWKLTQGITAYGRNLGESRERELAQIAGELLDRSKNKGE